MTFIRMMAKETPSGMVVNSRKMAVSTPQPMA
jgi:hypothetical protein